MRARHGKQTCFFFWPNHQFVHTSAVNLTQQENMLTNRDPGPELYRDYRLYHQGHCLSAPTNGLCALEN